MRAADDQLRLARALTASLDMRMRDGAKDAKKRNEVWQPDDAWRSDFDKANKCIVDVGGAYARLEEAERERLSGMTVEQLESQFKQELMRMAVTLEAEDWAALDQVRVRAVLRGAKA